MRFIHTSDWHLGKNLEGHSRIEEQKMFCSDFVKIVEDNDIDMVVIAGDIYDTANPSAEAEKLFYSTVSKIAANAKISVFMITGTPDSPERIEAASPLAFEQGILLFGNPLSKTSTGKFEGFEIVEAKKGMTKLIINREKVNVLTLPYPSEKRLNDAFEAETDEDTQKTYSQKIGQIFRDLQEDFEENSINIAVSHLFVVGGESSDSERPIQLGGSLLVERKDLPDKANYVALGHLHKPQKASELGCSYYSGSSLKYSKSERGYAKGAKIVEIHPNEKPKLEDIMFNNYKPIELFKCRGVQEALDICEQNRGRSMWSYFEIKTDEIISQEDIKAMKKNLADIIEIKPVITYQQEEKTVDLKTKSMAELFRDFYTFNKGVEPKGELMDMFMKIAGEEGGEE